MHGYGQHVNIAQTRMHHKTFTTQIRMSVSEDYDRVTDQSVIADDIPLSQFHVSDKSATSDDLIPLSQLLTKKQQHERI